MRCAYRCWSFLHSELPEAPADEKMGRLGAPSVYRRPDGSVDFRVELSR
jgi:hypothetical protein